jgi:hypothetical protein
MINKEKIYLRRVAELGCYLCSHLGHGATPAQLHHPRNGVGMAQRQSNWLCIPLCQTHHQDSVDGIHGQRRAWKLAGVGEMDALAWVVWRLNG